MGYRLNHKDAKNAKMGTRRRLERPPYPRATGAHGRPTNFRSPLGVLCVLAVGTSGLLAAGCVHPIADDGSGSAAFSADPAPPGELDVRAFQGGYGIDFFEQAAREYEAAHPGVTIKLQGDPRIWDQLRPLFISGQPPGLSFPGWGMDTYALIYERQVRPMDDALLTSPYGAESGTWRDTFLPEILKLGAFRGRTYMLPFFISLNGWWYNVNLFEENGWKPPTTYAELLELGEKIKAKGIAPLTYQGKYPYYALQGFELPWAISIGGAEVYRAAEALKPGAWKDSAFLKAAEMVAELRQKGFFQNGADGMSHTEAQMEFLQGRAAMIPCGTWLESEMKKQFPPGFKMAFIRAPRVDGGKGDPTSLLVGVEPWIVPTKGQNPALAIDYFKYVTSRKKAREFVLAKGTLSAVKGTSDEPLPETLRGPAQALQEAKYTWTTRYSKWYPALEEAARTAMAGLLQGTRTPQQFVDDLEAAAEKVRKDPNIPKHEPG